MALKYDIYELMAPWQVQIIIGSQRIFYSTNLSVDVSYSFLCLTSLLEYGVGLSSPFDMLSVIRHGYDSFHHISDTQRLLVTNLCSVLLALNVLCRWAHIASSYISVSPKTTA